MPLPLFYQPGHSVGMLAAVEHGPILCSDSNILCLSWKGRVPKSEKDKPVCRRRYYEEGWLATGNGRGVVGVTFTSSHCRRDRSTPQRINFNLRGHNSEVWNNHCLHCLFFFFFQYILNTFETLLNKTDMYLYLTHHYRIFHSDHQCLLSLTIGQNEIKL